MKIRAPGLAGWLAIVTASLVTVAVAAVSMAGVRLLRGLAEAEALTRVELAVAAAREGVRQGSEDMLTSARVLGERPTLQRLLRDSNAEAIAPYLHRYCEGAALDACAIVRDGEIIASIGNDVAWTQVLVSATEQGERFLATGASEAHALIGGFATVMDDARVTAISLRRMDSAFAERLGEHSGLEIRIVDFRSFRAGEGPLAVLNSDALSRAAAVAGHIPALDVYAASMPVAASTGETIALLQALLPESAVFEPVAKLSQQMLWIAIAIALLATTFGILIGRHWIRGVQRLTGAAQRIGAGDLSAAIPAEGGKELGVMAATMEDMRRNLVDLTSELRRREAEAQAVIGGIVEGVYAVDRERRIRFLNPQAEKLLGITADEAMDRFCGDVLKPAADEKGQRPCDRACPILAARRTGAADAIERIEPVPGRVRRAVIASAAPADGIQVQVLRDETELEAVRRTRDTVLANISHEFRTPLAAQLASIELLHDGLGNMTLDQQRGLVDSLQRGAQRLTWLIDNLLESVRIEAGQLAIRRQEVVLADVIQAARDLVDPLIEQRGQALEVKTMDDAPVIRGDRQRLVQVLVNLLANASKFGPPNSIIRIGARPTRDGGISIWVDDEGSGPADADEAMLFEQFRRAGGEDPEESGLGLGLFIVRSIVERHGGRASLLRTPEGRTRAQIELPKDVKP